MIITSFSILYYSKDDDKLERALSKCVYYKMNYKTFVGFLDTFHYVNEVDFAVDAIFDNTERELFEKIKA